MGHYLRALTQLIRRRRAAIALIVALSAPVLVGFGAMAVDLTYWYGTQESLQTAADAGALAAVRTNSTDQSTLQIIASNAADAATNNVYDFSNGPGRLTLNQQKQSQGMTIAVTASAPTPAFLGGVIGIPKPELQAGATAKSQYSPAIPPTQGTCYSSSSYTYLSPGSQGGIGYAHEAGIDPASCGNTSLIQPLAPLAAGTSGQVQGSPILLTSGGGSIPNGSLAGNLPNSVPSCSATYNPNNPSAVTTNGITTYFGPATAQQNNTGGGGLLGGFLGGLGWVFGGGGNSVSYSFTPIIVGPGSIFFDQQNLCTIPAGAYCGGLQINPGVTVDFVSNNGSDQFIILDGNLLMSTSDPFGAANDPSASFTFGGSTVGSLILDTQTTVDAAGLQNGTLVFTSTATTQAVNAYGTQSVDQLCPLGVLPTGVDGNGNPICPSEQTTVTNGVSTTVVNTASTVGGFTTGGYTLQSNQHYASSDTYTTTVSFQNGQATSWQGTELTTTGLVGSNGSFSQLNQQTLNYAGGLGNNASASPSSSPPPSCSGGGSNELFSSNSATNSPNLGLSYATESGQAGSIALNDTVAVCGSGQPLTATASGAEMVVSGSGGSATVFLSK